MKYVELSKIMKKCSQDFFLKISFKFFGKSLSRMKNYFNSNSLQCTS